jgi:predicted metal-dependent phosphoesterase TrpH
MKADFHVHTNRSVDGVHSPRVMVKCAKNAGLDTIAITDHGRLFPWIEARRLTREFGLLVIPGIEGGDIAVQKHWIALGISAVPQELSIRRILSHIQNDAGLSIAPHPHTRLGFSDYATLGFDAVEALNATEPGANQKVRNITHIPEVAGSDAHAGPMLGTAWTEIIAQGPAEDVLEAVRRGNCVPEGTPLPPGEILHFYYLYLRHRVFLHPLDAYRTTREVIRDMRKARARDASPNTTNTHPYAR